MSIAFTSRLNIEVVVNGLPTAPADSKFRFLYHNAQSSNWNPDLDIDWIEDIEYGSAISNINHTALLEFAKFQKKDTNILFSQFQWELQFWLVCQFLYGEQAALVGASALAMILSDSDQKLVCSTQVADEARHVLTFSRYVDRYIKEPYGMSAPLKSLLSDALNAFSWDMKVLGMQIIVEGLAEATFRLGAAMFHDPVIRRIVDLVSIDESRHVTFGILLLRKHYQNISSSEKRIREEFVLDCAEAIKKRFLLTDIWERLDIPKYRGIDFVKQSSVMIDFRRTIFSRIGLVLRNLDLMSDKMRMKLQKMQLLR
ncbi:para-aminobenzoate N-oxygenase AurF [Xenorhabdus cabanillasii]|uniref:Para-aminobenzoate N-oxygenase AurF n=1 Tax=Xenorhabdus cabanillasii TaxID=351673 RepID=A0A3D9UIL3_9GAMM|nr:ferritin-like domain-containing protein [Xenorhabdus cabanillasii]REF26465.1 para-aminobenzoate N-oxygenase AurF [Xenorhabdus cabanillasii]